MVRTGHGRYERAEPLPDPVRQADVAALSLSFEASTGSGYMDTNTATQDARSDGILVQHVA